MRLIDADSIRGYAKYIKTNEKFEPYIMIDDLSKLLDEQPTSYSVGKVVEELKRIQDKAVSVNNEDISIYATGMMGKAIEIVKQGGVYDDVCEWKMDNVGASIGCRSDLHHTGYVNRTYCPYCRKKIKVVE